MKRIFTILFSFGTLLAVQQTLALDNTNYTQAEELTPQEATTLAYLWEQEKHLRDIFIKGTECSTNPEVANTAMTEQEHMDLLRELLLHYDLEVPVPVEEVGVFVSFTPEVWSGWGWVCLNPSNAANLDPFIFGMAKMYEEIAILHLLEAIDQTNKQRLLDAYNYLLAGACAHLRSFVTLYDPDAEAEFLSQELFDQIMAGTFPIPVDGGFTINPGLNDAWYYPETDGQGFFISVFPDLGTVSLAWFTFETELPDQSASANLGDPGQRWLIAHGPYEGDQANLEVMSFSSGLFDTENHEPVYEVIGSVVLRFEDCNTGSVIYDLPDISRSGIIPIERVAIDTVPACEAHGQQPGETQ
jgi:hypothetical protein